MKCRHFNYWLLFSGVLFASCVSKSLQVVEGRFKHFQYATDSSGNVLSKKFVSTKWYYDSAIIYEVKPIMFGEMKKTNGEYFDREKFVYYRFVDLKTMRGQEYFYLQDTAKPVCGYEFPSYELPVNYNSILSGRVSDIVEPIRSRSLADTLIGGEHVKRIELVFSGNGGEKNKGWRQIVYLRKGGIPSFMRMETTVVMEGYYVWMTEGKSLNEKSTFGDFVGIEVEDSTLDENILKIFKVWRRNTNSMAAPISTYVNELNPCDMLEALYFKYDPGLDPQTAVRGEGKIQIIHRKKETSRDSTQQQNWPEND